MSGTPEMVGSFDIFGPIFARKDIKYDIKN